jgi:hypothetical protein
MAHLPKAVLYEGCCESGTLRHSWQLERPVDSICGRLPYCLKLASTPSVGVASVRGDAVARGGSAQVLIPAKSADCGATGDTSAEVLTSDAGGAAAPLPFNVLFG